MLALGMSEHVVAKEGKIANGERIVVELEGKDIGVFKIEDEYYAYLSWCVHQGGPCCEGSLGGTIDASFERDDLQVELDWVKEGKILYCPWHGWEYDITTGECQVDESFNLPSYDVEVEDEDIIVKIG